MGDDASFILYPESSGPPNDMLVALEALLMEVEPEALLPVPMPRPMPMSSSSGLLLKLPVSEARLLVLLL